MPPESVHNLFVTFHFITIYPHNFDRIQSVIARTRFDFLRHGAMLKSRTHPENRQQQYGHFHGGKNHQNKRDTIQKSILNDRQLCLRYSIDNDCLLSQINKLTKSR